MKSQKTKHESILAEYAENKFNYEKLAEKVCGIIEEQLKEEGVNFLSITARVKTKESIKGKLDRKSYDDIGELTDIVGLRIITYTESEIPKAEKIIRDSFKIHDGDCIDKSKTMAVNEFGYKSVHYVCDLGEERARISEYKHIHKISFEIQLRTILQHAWAEIEHDRNYKFAGELPKHLKRRFFLLAGALELLDREFENLSLDIDTYANEQQKKIENNEYDEAINTINVNEYIEKIFGKNIKINTTKEVIDEMRDFGIVALNDFNRLVVEDYLPYLRKHYGSENEYFSKAESTWQYKMTSLGIIRNVLMLADINKYFAKCVFDWESTDFISIDMLTPKYGRDDVIGILMENNIHIISSDS